MPRPTPLSETGAFEANVSVPSATEPAPGVDAISAEVAVADAVGIAIGNSSQPRFLDRVRREIFLRHYAIRTEESYVDWIRRFVIFSGKRHPSEMGAFEVTALLTYLAVDHHVAPATQAQAKSAILFLHRVVLNAQLPWLDDVAAAKSAPRLPVGLPCERIGIRGAPTAPN
jgi:hypothetical protein